MIHIQAEGCGVLQLELPERSAFHCPLTCCGCDVTLKAINIFCWIDHMLFTNISLNTFFCFHGTYQQLIKHVNTSKDIFLLSNSDVEFCSTGSTTYHWQMSLMEFALMCPLLDSSFIDLQNAT